MTSTEYGQVKKFLIKKNIHIANKSFFYFDAKNSVYVRCLFPSEASI